MRRQITCERATELIEAFAGEHILVIGDVMLDRYVHGNIDRVNPEASVPLLDVEKTESRSGGAGNVAKNVAALGGKAVLLSVVGPDAAARELKAAAEREGYATRFIEDRSRPTAKKTRFLTGAQPLLRVDHEARHDLATELEKKVIAALDECMQRGIQGIIISDYNKGVVTQRVGEAVVAMARQLAVPVAGDAKPARLHFVRGAAFVSPNLKEAQEYAAGHGKNALETPALARFISETLQTTACITLGADGMYVHERGSSGSIVPQEHQLEVFDISGAGDTAVAVMLLARLAGATFVEAACLGNAAGAVAVSHVGSVGVKTQELRDMICHEHE